MRKLYEVEIKLKVSGVSKFLFFKPKERVEYTTITRKIFTEPKDLRNYIKNVVIGNWSWKVFYGIEYRFYNDEFLDMVRLKSISDISFEIVDMRECCVKEYIEELTPKELMECINDLGK